MPRLRPWQNVARRAVVLATASSMMRFISPVVEPIRFAVLGRYRLPLLVVDPCPLGDFEFDYVWRNEAGREVGQMSATVLLGRGVFVRHIETYEAFQRFGYATAATMWLAKQHRLPIVPVKENTRGRLFWSAMRRRCLLIGTRVEEQVSQSDLRALVTEFAAR